MRILVTGAAGFVGAHAALTLEENGHEVIGTDMSRQAERLAGLASSDRFSYVAGELSAMLETVMPGVDQVWHFAANADIPLGVRDNGVDLRQSTFLTLEVLESMRRHGVAQIIFPSSSAVYGNAVGPVAYESAGPLLPTSLYGAGKLASEGLISAYTHTFGLRGLICRLGNVVGGMMGRGIVRDFIVKLESDPRSLPVLGDGRQRKSYVLVDDVIAGMAAIAAQPSDAPVRVVNVAAGQSLDVQGVATAVATAMGAPAPRLVCTSKDLSWAGDQPVIELNIDLALSTGWRPTATAAQAVRIAARRLLDEKAGAAG